MGVLPYPLSQRILPSIPLEQQLKREKILNRSGFEISSGAVDPLRRKDYYVVEKHMDGDAPKNFIRVYTYGQAP